MQKLKWNKDNSLEEALVKKAINRYETARGRFLRSVLSSLVPKIEEPYTAEKLRKRDVMLVAQGHKMWVTTYGSRASKVFDSEPYFNINVKVGHYDTRTKME